MNIIIEGDIAKIGQVQSFNWNGKEYKSVEVVIDTPTNFQTMQPVMVKFNPEKINISSLRKGDYIKVECNISSKESTTKTGAKWWTTTVSAWKIAEYKPCMINNTAEIEQPLPQNGDEDLPF